MAESAELASINQNTVLADLQIKMHMVFRKMATQISKELYFVFVFILSLNGVLASKFYDFTAFDIKTYKSVGTYEKLQRKGETFIADFQSTVLSVVFFYLDRHVSS